MCNRKSGKNNPLARTAAILTIVLLAACLIVSTSGCGVILKAGRAVWHRILPRETAQLYTDSPVYTDDWYGDETPEPEYTVDDTSDTPEPDSTDEPAPEPSDSGNYVGQPYIDIHSIHGSENLKSYIPATWQRGSSILQSEVMAMDIASVLWNVGYESTTLSAETDINGDGENEALTIGQQGNALTGVYVQQGGTTVNLLNLLSNEFWQAVSTIVDSTGTLPTDCVVQAFSLDLDNDGAKEILLAIGDNNTILAVSFLKYTGTADLYKEIGGIIGNRFLFVTADATLYVPMGNSSYGKYVEFGYNGQQLGIIGYNMD